MAVEPWKDSISGSKKMRTQELKFSTKDIVVDPMRAGALRPITTSYSLPSIKSVAHLVQRALRHTTSHYKSYYSKSTSP